MNTLNHLFSQVSTSIDQNLPKVVLETTSFNYVYTTNGCEDHLWHHFLFIYLEIWGNVRYLFLYSRSIFYIYLRQTL